MRRLQWARVRVMLYAVAWGYMLAWIIGISSTFTR